MPEIQLQQARARESHIVRPAGHVHSRTAPAHAMNHLAAGRQALGNQASQRILQAKLAQAKMVVGEAGDEYEKEADRLAETVVRMPGKASSPGKAKAVKGDEDKLIQTRLLPARTNGLIQMAGAKKDEEDLVRRSAKGMVPASVSSLETAISPASGSGSPLSKETREFFEQRFGHDFSQVRVHTDSAAASSAKSLNAAAFTRGQDIFFRGGYYQPATDDGRRLLAHELTHTIQQSAGRPSLGYAAPAVSSISPRTQRLGLDTILNFVKEKASSIPGYSLITVIIGKDPITDQPVERNAVNIIRGVLGLVGLTETFNNLLKSGAIEKAYTWFKEQIAALDLTWSTIKGLFKQAWDALGWSDLLSPSSAWNKIKNIFGPPVTRLKNFAVAAGKKVLEFIFEGVLAMIGGTGILGALKKAQSAFTAIINNPIGFVGNLVAAAKQGFMRFAANILSHLKTGLFQWLFGAMAGAGIQMPKSFDFKGILSLALQVLGLTYARIRTKIVKIIGEKPVAYLETAFGFLKTLVTQGPAAAWKEILQFASDLADTVISSIRDWVATSIIKSAITKLVTMFNPAGAIIQAIIAIYNTVMFFIERASQIAAVVSSFLDSIASIAAGNVAGAAAYVEATMARTIPVIIGFLARLIGLGGVSAKIKAIIQKIHSKVDRALDRVADFIVKGAKNLLAAFKGKKEKGAEDKKGESPDAANAEKVKDDAINEVTSKLQGKKFDSAEPFKSIISQVFNDHRSKGLKSLKVKSSSNDASIDLAAEASPQKIKTFYLDKHFKLPKESREVKGDILKWINRRGKIEQRGQTTYAAISVNSNRVASRASGGSGHAEMNLIRSSWSNVISKALDQAKLNRPVIIAMAINRAPCKEICLPLLRSAATDARSQIKNRLQLNLALRGTYSPKNPMTQEKLTKLITNLTKIKDVFKSEGEAELGKTIEELNKIKGDIQPESTTESSIGDLQGAGWSVGLLAAEDKGDKADGGDEMVQKSDKPNQKLKSLLTSVANK